MKFPDGLYRLLAVFDSPTGHVVLYMLMLAFGVVGEIFKMSEAHDLIIMAASGYIGAVAMMSALSAPQKDTHDARTKSRATAVARVAKSQRVKAAKSHRKYAGRTA